MHQKIRLSSKRNQVSRIIEGDESYISKIFINDESLTKERELLTILDASGANVPKILKSYEQELFLEDLGDLTLLSWYEDFEKHNSYDYTYMLMKFVRWLNSFYIITYNHFNKYYILNDVNFKNFMISGNEVYGIDFEQSGDGNIKTDAGKIAAFALTYDPAFTEWKIRFHDDLIEVLSQELSINKDDILQEERKELEAIIERRKK